MFARQALVRVRSSSATNLKKILPIMNMDGSDSAMFDNCLELLVLAGRSLAACDDDDDPRAVAEP